MTSLLSCDLIRDGEEYPELNSQINKENTRENTHKTTNPALSKENSQETSQTTRTITTHRIYHSTFRDKGIEFSISPSWRETNTDRMEIHNKSNYTFRDYNKNDILIYNYQYVNSPDNVYARFAEGLKGDPKYTTVEQLADAVYSDISYKVFEFTHTEADPGQMYITYNNHGLYTFVFPLESTEPSSKKIVLTSVRFTENEPLAQETDSESPRATTQEEIDALYTAQDYLREPISEASLAEKLKTDGYGQTSIDYALTNLHVDFSQVALNRASEMISIAVVEAHELYQHLTSEGFTVGQANYAVDYYTALDYMDELD